MNDSSEPDGAQRPAMAGPGAGGPGTDGPRMAGPGTDGPDRARRRSAGRSSHRSDRSPRDPLRTTVRGLGQLLITAGVIVLLFVVYEVWVTNLFGAQRQAAATEALDELWQDVVVAPGEQTVITQPGGVVVTTAAAPTLDPGERTRNYDTSEGNGFAKLYIPSFGPDFVFTVVEGVQQKDLYNGPGHYPHSQYPGEQGNFAIAGHRVNKGAPFDDLGLLNSCDAIVIETRSDWFVYRVLPMAEEVGTWADTKHAHCKGVGVQTGQYSGVYGREITSPTDIAQVYAVPHRGGYAVPAGAQRMITLTTCHPKFSDAQRMIIHGVLTASYAKADGFLPPEMQEAG